MRKTRTTCRMLILSTIVSYLMPLVVQGQATSDTTTESSQTRVENVAASSEPGEVIEIGRRLVLDSKLLEQKREYLVFLPASYHTKRYSKKEYPVLFLMDGNVQFSAFAGMVDYMGGLGGQIPEMIVVGVPHQNRTNELTPTQSIKDFRKGKTSSTLADSGGGDKFLSFLTEELIPKIDADYRTRPYRVFFGHSFGGLLGAHAFLKADDYFQSFLLADPSMWWDDRVMVKRLEENLSAGKFSTKNLAIYISRVPTYKSPDDEVAQRGFDNVANSLKKFAVMIEKVDSLRAKVEFFGKETHTSVPIQTLYQGLLHTFEGYEPPPELFLSPPEMLNQHFESVSNRVGLKLLPGEGLIEMWGYAFLNYDEDFRRRAIPLFELNVVNYPSSPEVHAALGNAYTVVGKHELARQAFQQALALDPENETAKTGLEEMEK